jgi:hypothetical protein
LFLDGHELALVLAHAGDADALYAILSKRGMARDDPQIKVRRVPVIFTQEKLKDGKTAQPGDVFVAREGQGA